METTNLFQNPENRMMTALDDYMQAVLKCQSVERKISYLINFGSLCYDYNQPSYASKAYKLALDICLANEDDKVPRYKEYALTAAQSIQYLSEVCVDNDCRNQYLQEIREFYKERFPTHQ